MIIGAHVILYSKDAEADRGFLRDVLRFPSVDAGRGWLIFGLPGAEAAVHPAESPSHELYLMTDDLAALLISLETHQVPHDTPHEERWGTVVFLTLPSGARLGVYQPKHPIALALSDVAPH